MRRKKIKQPMPERELTIEALSHEGRGIAHHEGKVVFVEGALPGERVIARVVTHQRRFDEARVEQVLEASDRRVEPPCPHASVCGGCSLQHMASDEQIVFKQNVLAEQFLHFGGLVPEVWLPPLRSTTLGYRRKARLGVRYVIKKEKLLVGFREKHSNFLVDMATCSVLDQRLGAVIPELAAMLSTLEVRDQIAQIEFAAGDDDLALIFRHLVDLPAHDEEALIHFCRVRGWQAWGQRSGPVTQRRLDAPGDERLYYGLPRQGLRMAFHPGDFTQVHAGINHAMIELALELLDVRPEHKVLDLFCGLGNFTLPLARRGAAVTGVEGSEAMTQRAAENAAEHGLSNVNLLAVDLADEQQDWSWLEPPYDRMLIDPPRSGAELIVRNMHRFGADKLVYVSCNPATLARDAGILVENGYCLRQAGVMDMFPHTAHVESIALFDRIR